MKRRATAVVLLAALGGGCMTTDKTVQPNPFNGVTKATSAPGMIGPLGEPVASRAGTKPTKADTAILQAKAETKADKKDGDIQQVNWDVKTGKATGLIAPVPGAVAAVGALPAGMPPQYNGMRTSVRFAGPAGMEVAWFANSPDTPNGFTKTQFVCPGRYNYPQGGIYRLKLSNVPNRPGLELYPTLEVIPAGPKTATFLAHSAVPVNITEEDLEQVTAGNLVTKVVYLPDPQFQDLAAAGPDEVVSSRLEPGVDPVVEAKRRGSLLLVIRLGNIDLEMGGTPGIMVQPNNPYMGPRSGGMPPGAMPPGGMPLPPPGLMPGPGGAPPLKFAPHAPTLQQNTPIPGPRTELPTPPSGSATAGRATVISNLPESSK